MLTELRQQAELQQSQPAKVVGSEPNGEEAQTGSRRWTRGFTPLKWIDNQNCQSVQSLNSLLLSSSSCFLSSDVSHCAPSSTRTSRAAAAAAALAHTRPQPLQSLAARTPQRTRPHNSHRCFAFSSSLVVAQSHSTPHSLRVPPALAWVSSRLVAPPPLSHSHTPRSHAEGEEDAQVRRSEATDLAV